MNYTKEMQEANIPPEMGMKFICNDNNELSRIGDFQGLEVEVIGVCSCDDQVVITFKHAMRGIGCGIFSPRWVKPVDTRTDTEKAVDDIDEALTSINCQICDVVKKENCFGTESKLLLGVIKAGKITDVKWVGND